MYGWNGLSTVLSGVIDRSVNDMFVFSNVAEFNVQGVVIGQKLRIAYENCTQVSFEVKQ